MLGIAQAVEDAGDGRQAEDNAESSHAVHSIEAFGVGGGWHGGDSLPNKNPAGRRSLPGHVVKRVSLTVSPASRNSDALPAQGLTFFATTELTRFLIAFFKLQSFEETIVLNFFLQNPHGFFEIVVEDFDFNCFQTGSTPFFSHRVNKLALDLQP